jgi:hypothetical protein
MSLTSGSDSTLDPESPRALFAAMRARPGMYRIGDSYPMAVGVLTGYELGRPGTLNGFAEWLARRLEIETSLDWPALVLQLAFPGEHTGFRGQSLTPDQGARAVDTLFALLDEFLATQGAPRLGA